MEGELRDDKGKSYSPILTEITVRSHGLPNEIPFSSDGVSALGIPIGKQQFVHTYLNDKIILKSIEDLQTIQRMPLIQAQHTLLIKSICHRLNHLWRLIPTIDVTNIHGNNDLPSLGLKMDSALRQHLQSLFLIHKITDSAWTMFLFLFLFRNISPSSGCLPHGFRVPGLPFHMEHTFLSSPPAPPLPKFGRNQFRA